MDAIDGECRLFNAKAKDWYAIKQRNQTKNLEEQ